MGDLQILGSACLPGAHCLDQANLSILEFVMSHVSHILKQQN